MSPYWMGFCHGIGAFVAAYALLGLAVAWLDRDTRISR